MAAFVPATCLAQLNITRQPDPLVAVQSGQTATLSVGVSGAPTPSYQWRRYGWAIPGATSATYHIPAASQFDNDFYDVLITSGGTVAVSQTARLLVTLPSYPRAITTDLSRSLLIEGPESPSSAVGATLSHAVLPDGRFYVAGAFSTVNGQARRSVVRFDANGSLDATFTAPEFDDVPVALALQPDGRLVVSGPFRRVDGAAVLGLVRLNANGTRDATFNPPIGFATALAGSVHVAASGNIYLTGSGIGTPIASQAYIARLLPSGAVDPTFTAPTFGRGNAGTNPSGFAFGPNEEIYVYGAFDRVNGVLRSRIARLQPSGAVDPSFDPGAGPNDFVNSVAVLSSGRVAIGGVFTAYNGTQAGRIARLTASGALDPSFVTGSGFSSQVGMVAELPGGALFVGSTGNVYNGTFVGPGARLTVNGTLDPSFTYGSIGRPDFLTILPNNRLLATGVLIADSRPGVRVLEPNGSVSAAVASPTFRFPARAYVMKPLPGGKVFVGGNFTHVNGKAVPYVMRLNADLSRDTTFPAGPGPTSLVFRSIVQPDGKIVLFTTTAVVRLNADGSNDPAFSGFSPAGFWLSAPPVLLSDGRMFVSTDSSFWAGSAVTNGLVVLEPNGTRASTHPYLPGPNSGTRITGVQRLAGGRLLVTGTFSTWNGIPRRNAVRLNADGSVDATFVADGSVQFAQFSSALARNGWSIQRDGRLIVGNDRQPADTLARMNGDGTRDRTFVSGLPQLFAGQSVLVQPDDRIITFAQSVPSLNTAPTGSLANVFVRLLANGALDPSFTVRGSGFWLEMALADNGELISNDGTGYLHRYKALPPPTIATSPTSLSAVAGTTLLLRVIASGEEPYTYQWFRDGVAIAGATSASLTLENAPITAAGIYTVAVTNPGGSVTSPPATVALTARPLVGAHFGTIGGTRGSFALYLREDGSGAFLGHLRTERAVLTARHFAVDADRRFRFTATVSVSESAPSSAEVSGSIGADGSVNAIVLGQVLSAPAATTSGATVARVGFYETVEAATSGLGYLIVGANGAAYAAAVTAGFADAGAISAEAPGILTGTLEGGSRVTGSVESDGLATAALLRTNGALIALSGGDNVKRVDSEKLINIATRSVVQANDSFTVGFVISGDRAKPVLLRAVGPTLAAFQIEGPLPAARLEVFRGTNSVAVSNDWGSSANASLIAATAAQVGAFALSATSRDAALLLSLEPGNYSARVTGQGAASGVALVEVYDATAGVIPRAQRIVNLSTLAVAGAGSSTLTAGFFVAGTVPKRLLIRGVGPSLTAFGVTGVLARPVVTVFSGSTRLALNAGWSGSPESAILAAAAAEVGAFALQAGSVDAALILNLAPGPYSAQVSGLGGISGTALVEIYELP